MSKEFCVQADVTMSGNIYVEAENEEEAIKKVRAMNFVASDLRNFYWLSTEIVDVGEDK